MNLITGGHTTLLSPDACQTAIDEALFEALDRPNAPSYVGVDNSLFFKTSPIDTIAYIFDEDSNVGGFLETSEQEEIKSENTFIGNQKTVRVKKWMKSIGVSVEAFKTDQVGKRQRIGEQIGSRMRVTKDRTAMVRLYGDAHNGTYFTTPDGANLASNSHTALKTGETVDNLETGALTTDSLWTAFVSLHTQKGQDGEISGIHSPKGLLTCTTQYKHLKEILNSELIADSGENTLNIFETDYGRVAIGQSLYLNSAWDGGTYKSTAVHLVSDYHHMYRKVLSDVENDLIEPRYSRTDSWEYRSRYLEVAFPSTWEGYLGMQGA